MTTKHTPGPVRGSLFAQNVVAERDAAREEAARLRAENEYLREALADIREWAKRDDFIRFDDGDIPLADYCARALHRSKP